MRRIGLAVVVILSLMLAPLASEAQEKVYRIGWLSPASAATGVRDVRRCKGKTRMALRRISFILAYALWMLSVTLVWAQGAPDYKPLVGVWTWRPTRDWSAVLTIQSVTDAGLVTALWQDPTYGTIPFTTLARMEEGKFKIAFGRSTRFNLEYDKSTDSLAGPLTGSPLRLSPADTTEWKTASFLRTELAQVASPDYQILVGAWTWWPVSDWSAVLTIRSVSNTGIVDAEWRDPHWGVFPFKTQATRTASGKINIKFGGSTKYDLEYDQKGDALVGPVTDLPPKWQGAAEFKSAYFRRQK